MSRKSKSITVISDPLMEPYYICKDDVCFTVNERIIPDGKHFRSKNGGKEYAKPQGYYPSFQQALEKVSQELMHTKRDYESLGQYLEEYKIIKNQIKDYIYETRSSI
tara:strand:- start:1606 stop:1926 length:321 start_codon:yes stop_codon:yes gene_type:complete